MPHSRRRFIRDSSIGVLTFYLGGCEVEMTPEEAHQAGVPRQLLGQLEASTLAALGEVLLPGAREAGLVEFVDHQLASPVSDQLLMIKYLGLNPPFEGFYQGGLAALNEAASAAHGVAFNELPSADQTQLVGAMAQDKIEGWSGPPAPFFYFVVRNDAVDVSYGTEAGFEALAIPYMAHIRPPSRWGE